MCVPRVAATGHHSKKKTLIPAEQLQPDVIAERTAWEASGAKVWFQPRYSPDYNPIEKMWSKVKAILRKISARTAESLLVAIGEALQSITASDAQNWFRHCGYLNPNTDT